jgi:hypothetical protein
MGTLVPRPNGSTESPRGQSVARLARVKDSAGPHPTFARVTSKLDAIPPESSASRCFAGWMHLSSLCAGHWISLLDASSHWERTCGQSIVRRTPPRRNSQPCSPLLAAVRLQERASSLLSKNARTMRTEGVKGKTASNSHRGAKGVVWWCWTCVG